MRPSALYSNTIIAIQSNKLLDHNKIRRMVAADSFDLAANVLFECGYDENAILRSGQNEDLIINNEMKRSVELFKKLCPDANVLACLLAKFDYHNARILYKSKFNAVSVPEATYPIGAIDKSKLERSIKNKEYNFLPPHMRDALKILDAIEFPTATEIDTAFDKSQTAEMKELSSKIKNNSVRQFFLTDDETVLKNYQDVFCLEMLLKWFILKQQELKIVKTILMGKKLGIGREKIRELLKGVK